MPSRIRRIVPRPWVQVFHTRPWYVSNENVPYLMTLDNRVARVMKTYLAFLSLDNDVARPACPLAASFVAAPTLPECRELAYGQPRSRPSSATVPLVSDA